MINSVTGTPATAPTAGATSSVDRGDQMGNDTFLKLLVAQMKYQDPSNPTSSSEFMAQTATFTQVQTMQQIAKQNTELLALQRSLNAGALVGHAVRYTDTDGTTRSGTVSSVRMSATDNTSQAVIGGQPIDLGRITEVGPTAS